MRFGSPDFLWGVVSLPLFVLLFIWAWRRRSQMAQRFASKLMLTRIATSISTWRRLLKMALVLLALLFLFVSLARPQWGRKMEWIQRKGLDIVLVQDISLSMMAQDIKPSRLLRARHEISGFLDTLQGDRIGLVAFAGEARALCPLTLDHAAARIFLDELQPGWLMPGTDIGAAMKKGMQVLRGGGSGSKYQIMVLLTDGEEHDASALEVARSAAEQGISIYTIGIGSREGVPIPVPSKDGSVQYKKDREGAIVTTRLEESTLQQIATIANGKYYYAGPGEFQLQKVLVDIAERERQELEGERLEQYQERYQLPLLVAILFLVLELLLGERAGRAFTWGRKSTDSAGSKKADMVGSKVTLAMLLLALLVPAEASEVSKGNKAYQKGDFPGALQHYDKAKELAPQDALVAYNRGTALYKAGNLPEAITELQRAMASPDSAVRRNTAFNLANAHFRKGEQAQGAERMTAWREAIALLKQTIAKHPDYERAKRNVEYMQRKLKEEIEKQAQQQQQQQDQKEKKPPMSDAAKQALARALELTRKGLYVEAKAVLEQVMQVDDTAQSLGSYIQRLQDVLDIQQGKKPTSTAPAAPAGQDLEVI